MSAMEGTVAGDTNEHKAADGKAATAQGGVFTCAGCGNTLHLPEQLIGRQAKCPKCGKVGTVARPEPSIDDVALDDLVEPVAAADQAQAPQKAAPDAAQDSLALDAVRAQGGGAAGQLRHFFAGNLPVNVLSGIVGGVHESLICLGLAMLAFSVPGFATQIPHALFLTLIPAALGSLLFALCGKLPVSVGGPDPASALAVFLLVAAVGSELSGAAPATAQATMFMALALAAILSGAVGALFSRLGVSNRSRFLSAEILGGMLAGFGVLLMKAWGLVIVFLDPQLANVLDLPMAEMLRRLGAHWTIWAPATGFGLAFFITRNMLRGIIWPLLLTVLSIAAWHFSAGLFKLITPGGAGALAPIAGSGLPDLLDMRRFLELLRPETLANIDWGALWSQKEFFAAVTVVTILPSLMRTNILESVLARDADASEQMRTVGASCMFSGLMGALPSSLSLSGSLGLRALGAAGPVAGFTLGLVCLGVALKGQPALGFIPLFVPLGVLLSTALSLPLHWLLRDSKNPLTNKNDQRLAWAAALCVALLGPVLGVFLCLALSYSVSLARATRGGLRLQQSGDVYHSNVDRSPAERQILKERGGQILVLRLQGFLFLGTLYDLARNISGRLRAGQTWPLKYVLLDLGSVTGLGANAVIGLKRLETLARQHGLLLLLTSVPLELEEHLEGLGYSLGGEDGVVRIYLNLDYAMEWCEDGILAEAGAVEEHRETLEELLCATFPEPRLVPALMRLLERQEVPKKRNIVTQGEPSDSMYFLESGKVHVELALPGGKLLRLKKMGPGTVFGEMGLYTSAPRSASVIATERCVVYKLTGERFKLVQAKAPSLAAAVNRFIVTLLAERVAEENAKNRAAQL
jgi:SulP family sulfate permease